MTFFLRLYLTIRGSGWFVPSMVGGVPFPFAWQGWAFFVGFVVLVAISGVSMPGELGWIVRIGLGVGYLAIGFLSFDRD